MKAKEYFDGTEVEDIEIKKEVFYLIAENIPPDKLPGVGHGSPENYHGGGVVRFRGHICRGAYRNWGGRFTEVHPFEYTYIFF